MIKNSFNTPDRYTAPEMKVVELDLSNAVMQVGSNSIDDADEEDGDAKWIF